MKPRLPVKRRYRPQLLRRIGRTAVSARTWTDQRNPIDKQCESLDEESPQHYVTLNWRDAFSRIPEKKASKTKDQSMSSRSGQ
jgi:hypothetical protein